MNNTIFVLEVLKYHFGLGLKQFDNEVHFVPNEFDNEMVVYYLCFLIQNYRLCFQEIPGPSAFYCTISTIKPVKVWNGLYVLECTDVY